MLIALVLFGCSHSMTDCQEVRSEELFFKTVSACEISMQENPPVSVNAPVSIAYCVEVVDSHGEDLAKLEWQLSETGPVLRHS